MKINFTKKALNHCYSKHGVTKERIKNSLLKGIYDIVTEENNNDIIFTKDFLAIVIDPDNNLRTAFIYNRRYYKSKAKQGKSCFD